MHKKQEKNGERLLCAVRCVLVLCALLFCTACTGGGVVLRVACFLQSPVSAIAAAQQMAEDVAVPVPNSTPSAIIMPSASPAASPLPSPTAQPVSNPIYGTVALIPDTGTPAATGSVVEQYYPNGVGDAYLPLAAGSLRNMTAVSNATVQAAISAGMPFTITPNSAEPQVLIMHTHATETYRRYEGAYYDLDDTARTTDKNYNVCAVGAAMAQVLNQAGIVTLHDTTLNDYPSYNASYGNSREVVKAYLAQYPSIKVVLDVHRDALGGDEVRYAPTTEINGVRSAQVMLIAGCDNGGNIHLPHCMENLGFAAAWQAQMEGDFTGLTRSAMFKYKDYNQDLTTGSLLIEVGGHGNNLNQAVYAGQLAAQSLARLLLAG